MGSHVFYGEKRLLSIDNCLFKNSIQPIHLSGADSTGSQTIDRRITNSLRDLRITKSIFDFCQNPTEDGGSLYVSDCKIILEDVQFINSVGKNGGGAFFSKCTAQILKSSFFKCGAKKDGGAVYGSETNVYSTGSYFVLNTADNEGGAFVASYCDLMLINSFFYENSAKVAYGGILLDHTTGQIMSPKFSENTAPASTFGTQFMVKSSPEQLIFERGTFLSLVEQPVAWTDDSYFTTADLCFDISSRKSFSIIYENGTAGQVPSQEDPPYYWGVNKYDGMCQLPPALPGRYMKELFHFPSTAPEIEWWRIYFAIGVFVVTVLIMMFAIPVVFFPKVTEGAKQKGK